jgi:D-alanine-D-alanine ligase
MKIAIIYGGKSAEHKISIRSVVNILNQIESAGLQPISIAINEFGKGFLQNFEQVKVNPGIIATDNSIYFSPGNGIVDSNGINLQIDCVFPLIHGTYGEDGCLQGALEISQTPYIGENVATSAICMDKHLTKIILQQSNINVTPFLMFYKNDSNPTYSFCSKKLGERLIVKPASSGSSFGVSLVNCEEDFKVSVELAGKYSDKILIEKFIEGREINCALYGTPAVIGNLGEIINVKDSIYSYDEKYVVKSNELQVPANLPSSTTKNIKALALKCFKALNCKSMARIDIFLDKEGQLYINEVNTIPAFSKNSIYPRLLESAGISQKSLILHLIKQCKTGSIL